MGQLKRPLPCEYGAGHEFGGQAGPCREEAVVGIGAKNVQWFCLPHYRKALQEMKKIMSRFDFVTPAPDVDLDEEDVSHV